MHELLSDRLRWVLEVVEPLANRFVARGFGFYLVGGLVRDAVAGRELAADIDVTTDATPDEIVELGRPLASALWTQGARFGTIGLQLSGTTVEITTHRKELYDPSSRKPSVHFSSAIEDDLVRRDFTVNAMAVSIPDGVLVDPYGGRRDLAASVLRTPLDPTESFTDDPLRMFRAARFAAGYHLTPVAGLEDAISALADRVGIVSIERIKDEFDKLLVIDRPDVGLEMLARTGLLAQLEPFAGATPSGFGDVAQAPPRLVPRYVALFRRFEDEPPETRRRMGVLRASTAQARAVADTHAAAIVMEALCLNGVDRVSVRHLLADHGEHLADAIAIARVDAPSKRVIETTIAAIEAQEGVETLRSPLDGGQVLEALGGDQGPRVGEALAMLRAARLEQFSLAPDQALELLRRWGARASGDG